MIQHNLKIIFRYFLGQKIYTLTSLLILAIGLASALLISLWVANELGSDKFHPNLERIYLVTGKNNPEVEKWDYFAYHCASILKENYPEIEEYASIAPLDEQQLSSDENHWFQMKGIATQQGFLNILGFELLKGDAGSALMDNNSILLTQEAATRLFGDEDPMGKTVSIRHRQVLLFQVSGIFKDIRDNSSIKFDYLVPFEATQWGRMDAEFVLISPGLDLAEVNNKIKFTSRETRYSRNEESIIRLFPFSEVYFNSEFYPFQHGEKKYPQILALIAIVILIISVINYTSLATARTVKRAKDIGINKVMGAVRGQLLYQFLVESFLFTIIAAILAIGITELFLPTINSLSDKNLVLDFSNFNIIQIFLLILLFTFIISGLFPAILFTSFSPINSIRGIFVTKKSIRFFRQGLVISLFTFSMILIISTFFLVFQLDYMQSKNPGYSKDNIVKVDFINRFLMMSGREKYNGMIQYLESEIEKNPNFICTDNGDFPTEIHQMDWKITVDGTVDQLTLNTLTIGYKFAELFDINILDGFFFSELLGTTRITRDSSRITYLVVNNKAVEVFKLTDPVGIIVENLSWGKFEIIGVIDDFNFKHMSVPIEPLMLVCLPYKSEPLIIKIKEGTLAESMEQIEGLFNEINPGLSFEYEFFDQYLEMMYRKDRIIAKIVNYFAIISVIMAVVALIGFASYTIEQKSKEIGIRKIFGAGVMDIMFLLAFDFTKWVLTAFIISCPVTYILMSNWLENFAFRIDIKWWIFILVGLMSIIITLLSVSWQSFKAAKRNPIETLRYE